MEPNHSKPPQNVNEQAGNPNASEQYDSYIRKFERELRFRKNAAQRLHTSDFWIQIISIYYSCFTAVVAIWSLTETDDFLNVPSAILTVLVAIVVTYANAQNCSSRAKDLEANYRDLARTLARIKLGINSGMDDEKLMKQLEKCYKKLGDSESSNIIDKWKCENKRLHRIYVASICLFIVILFLAPFIIIRYWKDFTAVIGNLSS